MAIAFYPVYIEKGGREMGKTKKENPDKIGAGKFWAWQARAISAAIVFIVLGYVTIYCTNTLKMPAVLVGTLLMISKLTDGITDLFAGYIVDNTKTRFGKARPYEFAIIGAWLCTWLLFSAPGEASLTIKSIWVLAMYICVNSICVTLLSACNNAYMIRAFKTNGQRIKVASFGGIAIMLGSIIANISFPILMNRIATSPAGWSKLMAMVAVPMALIGILRFVFVKETVQVEETGEKPQMKDVMVVLKKNPYVYMIAFMQLVYSLVTGMGINQFFYTYIVGDIEKMGMANLFAIVVLPLLAVFPLLMKKVAMGKIVQIGCIAYVISGIVMFASNGNMSIVIIAVIIMGVGALPVTYLTDLLMIDCGSYNASRGYKRMDGTIGAIKGFANKVGGAFGSGLLGILLGMSGFDGALEVQPDSALLMIKILVGVVPAILFLLVAIVMHFYKLDKMMPEINKSLEEKKES